MAKRKKYRKSLISIASAVAFSFAISQNQGSLTAAGFVDLYYAYAFTQPPDGNRRFTTQPLRHNEINLNLAVADLRYLTEDVRGRLALQAGTYVQSNCAGEPQPWKSILEGSVGLKVASWAWVDFGIFPSHIGFETILSKDNWTYSRSLCADLSPYFESGIALTTQLTAKSTVRILVLNGWQNIQETNSSKAIGTQVVLAPSEGILLNWSTFVGNEMPDSLEPRLRFFNDFYSQVHLDEHTDLALTFDVGFQKSGSGESNDVWHTAALILRKILDSRWTLAGRIEYYHDRLGVIVPTGTPHNLAAVSGSLNLDCVPATGLLFRTEVRLFSSVDEIFPTSMGPKAHDGFLVTSISISF